MSRCGYTWKCPDGLAFNVITKEGIDDVQLTSVSLHPSNKYTREDITKIEIPSHITVPDVNGGKKKRKISSIDKMAFVGYSSLAELIIPKTITCIDEDAFLLCSNNFVIHCEKKSFAETWAKNSGFKTVPLFSEMEKFFQESKVSVPNGGVNIELCLYTSRWR